MDTMDPHHKMLSPDLPGAAGNTLSPSPSSSRSPVTEASSHSNIDEESGSEEDVPLSTEAEEPRRGTRKVLDNMKFSQFMRDHQEKLINSTLDPDTKLNEKSMHLLVREAESDKIISSPREYQVEIFERAKQKNIIAVLDTGTPTSLYNLDFKVKCKLILILGTGKTLIAALLLRHILDQELEDRSAGKTPRVAFFLVHTPW